MMTIETENLILAPYLPRHLRALIRSTEDFENTAGMRVADGVREQFLSASAVFMQRVENGKEADPWLFGFAVVHKIDNVLMVRAAFRPPGFKWRGRNRLRNRTAISGTRLCNRSRSGPGRVC